MPCIIAEVKVSAQNLDQTGSAFSQLFNYISRGNRSSQKIAMTAPVVTAQKSDSTKSNEWYVSFIMPSGSSFGHLPDPSDPQVKLRELESETCVAKSFRGRAYDGLSRRMAQELRASAAQADIALSDETRICRFDPPFKPGFLQYNEIVIPAYLGAV